MSGKLSTCSLISFVRPLLSRTMMRLILKTKGHFFPRWRVKLSKKQLWMQKHSKSSISKIENSTMNKKRSSKRNSKSSNWPPDGCQILLSPLTLVFQLSIHMAMGIRNQHTEEQFTVIIWKHSILIHILVGISRNLVRSIADHCLEELSKLELQDQEVQRKDQSRWQENQFHQESHQTRNSYHQPSLKHN